jgi:zinc transport system substrate-binding protein
VRIIPITTVALACVILGACGSASTSTNTDDSTTFSVAASFYPLQEIVQRVGGDHVRTIALTPPGQGAHDVQLTAKKLTELSSASLVFYMGDGFQPDVEKAIKTLPRATTAIDVLTSVTLLPLGWQLEGTTGVPDGEVLQSGKDHMCG